MHLNDGQLRANLDRELNETALVHLHTCKVCQERLAEISDRARIVSSSITLLKPSGAESSTSLSDQYSNLQAYIDRKEDPSMFKKVYARQYRPTWVGVGLVLLIVVALAFPPVQAIANNFLGLFRVEQVAIVQVNPVNLSQTLGNSTNLEAIFTEDIEVNAQGEPQIVVSAKDASDLAGIPVRLPTDVQGQLILEVEPPAQMSFQVNLNRIQAVIDELNLTDISLPEGIDGTVVSVDVPRIVSAVYGECSTMQDVHSEKYDPDDPESYKNDCTRFVQMSSPSITAPPGVDMQKIGQAYLEVLGMDAEDAARFSQNIDWSTTLVLPLPIDGFQYSEVPVDGVTGTLITSTGEGNRNYTLLWVVDGITYALTGNGSTATAITIANSLE